MGKKRTMEFTVMLYYGGGDGGEICVDADVSDKEYELLKECCRNDDEMEDFEGLEDLCERIEAEARGENDFIMSDDEEYDPDEENDILGCSIYIPQEIYDAIEEES